MKRKMVIEVNPKTLFDLSKKYRVEFWGYAVGKLRAYDLKKKKNIAELMRKWEQVMVFRKEFDGWCSRIGKSNYIWVLKEKSRR